MGRDNVRQGFLQNVGRNLMVEEAIQVQLAHGGHAAETGALRGGNHRRMHRFEDFGRREACGQVGVDRGDDVPQGDLVDVADHGGRNAPLDRVEALRELASNRTGHGRATRHANHGAGMAGDVPFAGFDIGREAGVRFVKLDVLFGNLTSRNREGHIVVKEHLGFFLVGAVLVVVAHAFVERTHAGACHDLVMVAFRDILLRHEVAVNVVPARLGAVVPRQQTHVPCQFEHRAGRQIHLTIGMNAEFGLEAGTAGAPRSKFAHGHDDDFVFRTSGDVLPIGKIDFGLTRSTRAWQRLDKRLGRGIGFVACNCVLGIRRFRLDRVFHGFRTQCLDVDRLVAESAGQIHIKRGLGCFDTGFAGGKVQQFNRDFGGGIGLQTVTLHHFDQRIIATHQARAAHPTDLRMGEGHTARPHLFGASTVHNRIKCALHFAIGTVAAENTAVRRSRQHHMQLMLHIGVGTDLRKSGNRTLNTPQHEASLGFKQFAGIGKVAMYRRSREREEQARLVSRLENRGGRTGSLLLHIADPSDQRVHITVA